MKGSAVNAMAKQMQQEAEAKAKKAEADLAARRARRLGISSEDSGKMSMSDYKQLARQAGMKGSAVNAMAKQMQQEAEAKAKKAEADIAATEALIAARSAPKATAYDKAEQLIDRLIFEGRIDPAQKNAFLLRALRLERDVGGDFSAISELLGLDTETANTSTQGSKATVTLIDGQPV
jgi:membrane protein involved in colicin uptake